MWESMGYTSRVLYGGEVYVIRGEKSFVLKQMAKSMLLSVVTNTSCFYVWPHQRLARDYVNHWTRLLVGPVS